MEFYSIFASLEELFLAFVATLLDLANGRIALGPAANSQ
jgi:hypothetical protein